MSQNPYSQPGANPYSTPHSSSQMGAPKNHAQVPGIILIVIGAIWLVLSMAGTAMNVYTMNALDQNQLPPNMNAESYKAGQMIGVVVGALVYLIGSIVAIFGGISMMRGKGYRNAFAAAVVACIPCLSPCILLGIPFGIWGIVALNNPETKAFFAQNDR